MTTERSVVEAVMVAAIVLTGALFWHLHRPFLGDTQPDPARAAPPAPAPMAGGVPVLALGQNAVAPDRRWLLIPRGA